MMKVAVARSVVPLLATLMTSGITWQRIGRHAVQRQLSRRRRHTSKRNMVLKSVLKRRSS